MIAVGWIEDIIDNKLRNDRERDAQAAAPALL
jgi:hypothetical protein